VVIAEFEQSVFLGVGDKIDVPAIAAIAATRASFRHKFLAAEGDAPMPAVSGAHRDLGFVYKHFGEKKQPRSSRTGPCNAVAYSSFVRIERRY
jgi:hypothetical protein